MQQMHPMQQQMQHQMPSMQSMQQQMQPMQSMQQTSTLPPQHYDRQIPPIH